MVRQRFKLELTVQKTSSLYSLIQNADSVTTTTLQQQTGSIVRRGHQLSTSWNKKNGRNFTCILCEDSPVNARAEIVTFSVSLTGHFEDVYSSLPYRYYEQAVVKAIYPRYGPKDGDTVVQVWGENFLDLGDDFRCNFGTRSTKAFYHNDGFLWCYSAQSDVVGKAEPFSISMNRQQNS